jgi:peptidoglycan/xylan/chitin deacetylase (PgdA/CDA1 family)
MAVMAVGSCLEDGKFYSYFFPNNLSDYANLKESIDPAMSYGTRMSNNGAARCRWEKIMIRKILLIGLALSAVFAGIAAAAEHAGKSDYELRKEKIVAEFSGRPPKEWGETVTGVKTRLATGDRAIALTLDACGSANGKGFDAALINYLEREKIPATLFINARWIDANRELFLRLAANPLFEIGNHGLLHKPASVNGRSVYGINGTKDVAELVDEIELNTVKIRELTGKTPRWYRCGTAFYDEVSVAVVKRLGYEAVGFNVLGDAGASFNKDQVREALLKAGPGSIVIMHMNHPEGQTAAGALLALPELKKRGFRFVKLSDYELE